MRNKIITSKREKEPNFLIAAVMSFFFTGLGQMYNGELAKGIVLFLIRILCIILGLVLLFIHTYSGEIDSILWLLAANFFLWIFSLCQALVFALTVKGASIRGYNRLIFYVLFSITTSAIMIPAVISLSLPLSVYRINEDSMEPNFHKNELILVNRVMVNKPGIGDVVQYSQKDEIKIGRVMERGVSNISWKGPNFLFNKNPLMMGPLSENDAARLGMSENSILFYEMNGGKKYAFKAKAKDVTSGIFRGKRLKLSRDELLIAQDNRINYKPQVINISAVKGKCELIIIGAGCKRLFNKPYIP